MVIYSKLLDKPISLFEKNDKAINIYSVAPVAFLLGGGLIEDFSNAKDAADSVLETIKTFATYIANPTLILVDLWNYIYILSHPVMLCLYTFSILMYMLGFKGFKKYIPFSLVIFTLIQSIGRV